MRVLPLAKNSNPPVRKKRLRFLIIRLLPRSRLGRLFIGSLIILGVLAAALAYSGLVRLPVFTQIFYRPPQPERTIALSVETPETIGQVLGIQIEPRAAEYDSKIKISEMDLTYWLRQSFVTNTAYPIREIQTVIEDRGIEFFLVIKSEERDYRVKFISQPYLEKGQIEFKVTSAQFENLPLPASLVDGLAHQIFRPFLEKMNQEVKKYLKPATVTTEKSYLTITSRSRY